MRGNGSNMIMDIKVHEFVNKSTWKLHLALHVNDIFVGMAKANMGNSIYDNETVVAAMKCLKNEYFKAIGSPMRYDDGKLIILPADEGIEARKHHTTVTQNKSISATEQILAISH
jgi:hypothetical protein